MDRIIFKGQLGFVPLLPAVEIRPVADAFPRTVFVESRSVAAEITPAASYLAVDT